jgi:hypothetical protein
MKHETNEKKSYYVSRINKMLDEFHIECNKDDIDHLTDVGVKLLFKRLIKEKKRHYT